MTSTFENARPAWPVSLFNGAARAGSRLGLRERPLTAERLLHEARRKTGLHDLGEGGVELPLRILMDSFDREARLHAFGRLAAYQMLFRVVCNRLKIVDTLARNPDISEQGVRRPLFIVGFPRTGTTLLHNLLAQDPAARPLLMWESVYPTPPPRKETRASDPRIRRTKWDLKATRFLRPEIDEVHDMSAERPAECIALQQHTLVSWAYPVFADLPSYESWLWEQERETFVEAYRFYLRQLQLLQWRCAGNHWVLKSPAHLQVLDALVQVFPDACIVQTHRDPSRILPSACSLFAVVRSIMSDDVRPRELGRQALEVTRKILDRMMAFRDRAAPDSVLDVQYRDLVADPWNTVSRIYTAFGLPMPPDMEPRVRRWLAENPRHKKGVHRYSTTQFGLQPGDIEAVGRDYRERFHVPVEA